ncbi:MAG: DinB family protein [Bacillota bacterium]
MKVKRTIVSKRQNYIDEYKAASEKVKTLLEPLTQQQLNWSPSPGEWSVAQCISHLIVTGNEYLQQIKQTIKHAAESSSVSEDPLRYSLVGKLFVNMMEPPVKKKMKHPKEFNPAVINQKDLLIREFSELNEELIAALQSSENLDISRIKIISPVSKFLRFNLTDVFAFTAAHERRHIWQAENIMKAEGFPE